MKTRNMTTPQLRGGKMSKLIFTMLLGFATAAFTDQALAQGGTWATKTSLPTAQGISGTSVVNGIIYAVGGQDNGGIIGRVEAYNPATDAWSTKASMPTPRGYLSTSVVNGIIYAVGG